jgi:hypothetical protein
MAEPVIVPIHLEVTDIDMSNINLADVQKDITTKMAGVRKSMAQVFSQIDTSKASKPLLSSMQALESSFISLNRAQAAFNKETAKVGKSTEAYKKVVSDLEKAKIELSQLKDMRSNWENSDGEYVGTPEMWEHYLQACEQYEAQLGKVMDLQKQVDDPGSFVKYADATSQAGVEASLRKVMLASAQFNQKAQNFNQAAEKHPYTQDYQTALTDLEKIEKAITKLNEKYKEMQALGKLTPDGLAKMKYEAEQLQGKLNALKAKLTEMVNNGTAFAFGNGNAEAELNGINSRLAESSTKLDEISGASARITPNISAAHGAISSLSKTVNKLALGFIKALTGCIALGKQGKSTGTSLSKIFNKLKRSVLMYGFGFRSAYFAIRRLRTLVVKEFKLLAQSHSEINSQVTSLTMAFNRLKGSLGTALQPIASVVIPILKTAMNHLTGFLESLGRFTATLTGQGYIYKAVAKNIDSVADSAKKTIKQLGSYDKLEVINKDKNDLSDELGIDYKKVGIEGGSNFAKLIKEAWEKQDFTEVGLTIGNKLVEALNGVQWGPIREKAKGIATSVATLINGFFSTPDLGQSIGTSIANALGTAIDFAHTTLSTLNFEQIGQVAGNAINSFIDKMTAEDSWAKAGQSVSKAIRGIIEIIKTTLETVEWFAVGQAIGTYISNIEWGKVLWDFATLVGAILKAIGEALAGWTKEDPLSAILVTLIVVIAGALTAAAKLFALLKTFADIKKVLGATGLLKGAGAAGGGAAGGAAESIDTAATNAESVSTSTSNLTSKLTTLVKNLALGLVILLEVAAAAIIFVGAIWVIGLLLQQVIEAWKPVLENSTTVNWAMLQGTVLLVAIGAACFGLGVAGAPLAGYIGLGMLILLEMGAAAILFLAEIWAIGRVLQEVIKAWEPVLANAETVETAIEKGTTLLVAIGVVTAALGVATVASAGLLPLAIGLGTALLVELAAAFVLFVASLVEVADQLRLELHPSLDQLNAILPPLSDNMEDFTEFMKSFANRVVEFTKSNIIAGIGATIDKIVGIFTTNPIQHLYDEVTDQTKEFNNLVPALKTIIPLIDAATKLVGEYKAKMGSFESSVGGGGGFLGTLVKGAKGVINGLIGMFEGMVNGVIRAVNFMIKALNKLSFDVPDWVPAIGGKKFGFNIKTLNEVKIPRLAQGAVIPPNKEFLAMLGDQKSGTNIEAPLDTIKQALAEVLAEVGGGNREPIVLQVNGRTLAQVVWDEQTKRYKQTGKYAPAY